MEDLDPHVHVEALKTHSIEEPKRVLSIELESSWMDPILCYLRTGALPDDNLVARKVSHQAFHYVLYDDKLYKRSLKLPLLKCLLSSEMDYVIREVHEGIYNNHLGGLLLAYYAAGCRRVPEKMRCMPETYPYATQIGHRANCLNSTMDVHLVENYCIWTFPSSPGIMKVLVHGYRLIHQIGGGQTSDLDYRS